MSKRDAMEQYKGSLRPKADPALTNLKSMFGMEQVQRQIAAALPRHLSPERMIRIALTAVQRSKRLLQCDPWSIVKAVVESSELGLEPSGVLGHAYLVPRRNKDGKFEAQLQIGYRGFIELAGRSGRVRSVIAEIVYDCDIFEYEQGLEPKLRHVPALNRLDDSMPICVYAVAHFTDGGTASRVLTLSEIEKRRQLSKSKKDSPWDSFWDEMARKTAIRSLAKYLPLSPELTRASVIDEGREAGIRIDSIDVDFTRSEVVDPETGEVIEREPGQEG